eukprot:NODE_2060_length_1309_cov_40.908730_g1874_i0.p1 GENE.NODE_2060_length_1309_cov_40.908730_g1874_i0~~NODE_2060_length_1309_cov_40.908730_g1874_i0.p1  ORF type:complete len:363 (+),score=65.05 NODE_2060_length_1309_cov_40.908730_g1874_i0:57-1091(+)
MSDVFFKPVSEDPTTDTPRPAAHPPPHEINFIADPSLHRVAKHLRMLGVDCVCRSEHAQDPLALLHCARRQDRLILTTSEELLDIIRDANHSNCVWSDQLSKPFYTFRYFYIKGAKFQERLRHVIHHFNLTETASNQLMNEDLHPRCTACGAVMIASTARHLQDRLDASILTFYTDFWTCEACSAVAYGLREKLDYALRELEAKNIADIVRSSPRFSCTFTLPRELRWLPLQWLTGRDIRNLATCCRSFATMVTDNLFWKWRVERQLHTLTFDQIKECYGIRKTPEPFASVPWRHAEDTLSQDEPKFWMQQYRKYFVKPMGRSSLAQGASDLAVASRGPRPRLR